MLLGELPLQRLTAYTAGILLLNGSDRETGARSDRVPQSLWMCFLFLEVVL